MPPGIEILQSQRSHMLLVFSDMRNGREADFLEWYQDEYVQTVRSQAGVTRLSCYRQHELDVTKGKWPRPPMPFLNLIEISVDGAESAEPIIDEVMRLHDEQQIAQKPSCWIYYPVSEKVGRLLTSGSRFITVAFANGVEGKVEEFREFYATQHVRHALTLPSMANGQCWRRTEFQKPGSIPSVFDTIAIYEMQDTVEALVRDFTSVLPGTLRFPSLDLTRFSESAYVRLPDA